MKLINEKLQAYLQAEIFPLYDKNEQGHGICHIHDVIRRSLDFVSQFTDINKEIVYTIAVYHDIAHHIDKDNHEILSAQIFYEDEALKQFFTEEERFIMKEAIEDHRASLKTEPRNIYGKILSSADRTYHLDDFMKRADAYTRKYYPNLTEEQIIARAYQHLQEKYGREGYSKMYVFDLEYQKFKEEVAKILQDKVEFKKRYLRVNNKTNTKGETT